MTFNGGVIVSGRDFCDQRNFRDRRLAVLYNEQREYKVNSDIRLNIDALILRNTG